MQSREITTHKVNDANQDVRIEFNPLAPDGSGIEYRIGYPGEEGWTGYRRYQSITFRQPVAEPYERNGVTPESLLAVLIDYFERQTEQPPLPAHETSALIHCRLALRSLEGRGQ